MENALKLQKILSSKGYRTLAAGGFVRDYLMKLTPKDIDLATEALPEKVIDILKEYNIKTIPTGLKHGTVTAILEDISYEITTLRIDKFCNGREAEVEFVRSFKEDANRRDLTINALFMDLDTLEVFDFIGGIKDIEDNILRFVGNPKKRIQEDYLRILRFYRFAARYGYILDDGSIEECRKNIKNLDFISKERIRDEILKLILEPYVLDILECHRDIIFYVFPELENMYNFEQSYTHQNYDLYLYTGMGISYLTKFEDAILSLAFLYHDVAKPLCYEKDIDGTFIFHNHTDLGAEIVERVGNRLKLSTMQVKELKFIIKNHLRLKECMSEKDLRYLIKDCFLFGDEKIIFKLYYHYLADLFALSEKENPYITLDNISAAIQYISKFFKKGNFTFAVSGEDILSRYNLKPGPEIGKLKEKVIQALINGDISNTPLEIWSYLDKEV